ncbi:MAG: RNA polymerase sigma factor, partial [Anaerolineales bacterium]
MTTEAYDTLDDERLLGMVARAHEPALGELYDRYHRLVFSMALNFLGDHSVAEEVTQDVYMRIWRRAGS